MHGDMRKAKQSLVGELEGKRLVRGALLHRRILK